MKNKLILLAMLIGVSASAIHFMQMKKQSKKINPHPVGSYDAAWLTVDSLAKKGLYKSALDQTILIYNKARNENNPVQLVKSVIHRIRFQSETEEDEMPKMINDLKKDCAEAPFPANPILHSMLAETYWNFYQQNRWKFMNRTQTTSFKNDDINTWDLRKIFEETVSEYKLSVADKEKEMKVQINVFDEVLEKGTTEEARRFRPSLYDFLAHRALDFFMNSESGLIQPVNSYKIDAAWYLNDVDMFLNFGLQKNDSLSMEYNAVVILQDLIRFHQDDAHPGALIDADIKRLKFIHRELTIANKDSLYIHALEKIVSRYKEYPGSTDALYEIATMLLDKGQDYHAGDNDDVRLLKLKAEHICDTAIARFPYSQGGINCKHLKGAINQKSVSFDVASVTEPDQIFPASVKYTNISKLFLRAVRIDQDEDEGLYGEKLVRYYLSLPLIKEWSITLPADSDHQTHSLEFAIPALPAGKYVLLASTSETFSFEKNAVAYNKVWISNLSSVSRRLPDGSYDVYVMNRSTGVPLKGAQVTVFTQKYNYTSRRYVNTRGKLFVTNEEGYANVSAEGSERNFDLEIVNGNDKLFLKDNYYSYGGETENAGSHDATYFFTDRSIYRPGQTIYFKGIVVSTDGEKSAIKPGYQTTVAMYDVNSQKISEQKLTANEYGTFNGSFTAPQGVLTGKMRLQNESGVQYFSVEEYKRPKFEVTFQPLTGSYLLNDRIAVVVKSETYSGAKVTDAKVTYRVTRNLRLPWWFYGWKQYYLATPLTEITNGTASTDDNGTVMITFDALADASVSKEINPVFVFTVNVDVTDLNGETHSSKQDVLVSYQALMIETDLKNFINREEENSFVIKSRNMAGNFEPAQGIVKIRKLREPDRLLRSRLWDAPDRHLTSREEFQKQFPHDNYDVDDNPEKWEKQTEMLSQEFNTALDSTVTLDAKKWDQGKYEIEILSKDKYSHEVKHVRYINVFDPHEKSNSENSFGTFIPVTVECEPGQSAKMLIGSSAKNVKVLYEIEYKKKIVSHEWITLNNEQKLIEIPVEEKHRGNFAAHFTFVNENRFYHFDQTITVPWSNKNIDINFETYRDKLLPGAKEEWRLKLSGKFSEKIAAEMLVSMYDASLDAFTPHQWNFNLWASNNMMLSLSPGKGFTISPSSIYSTGWNDIPAMSFRKYDELNWFGYAPGGRRYDMNEVQVTGAYREEEMKAAPMSMKDAAMTKESYNQDSSEKISDQKQSTSQVNQPAGLRTNFSETAFFYPSLLTNEKNEIIFSFTMPDAVTRWKLMALAHTKALESGTIEKTVVTQKELMVAPNAPRFFREGDSLSFPCKITNLTDTSMEGAATLSFYDALTNDNVTKKILTADSEIHFNVAKGGNTSVGWKISIPEGFSALKYRVTAQAKKFSDGEEQAVPVLTNRMLVTESMPVWANADQSKSFSFDKLKNNSSSTLKNYKLTLEFTSNPAWYAIQALPYMMEFPYECSEQIFSRYYANAIATSIANSNPKIRGVIDSWKMNSPESFLSALEKNQELKSALLQQTPWVLDAKDESERKKRVALLFDLNKMSSELQVALTKLEKKQNPDGSWSWFEGMPDDRYITQYIAEGFGHLEHLGIISIDKDERLKNIIVNALQYLDARIDEDYKYLLSSKADMKKNHLTSIQIYYLYARSFFKDQPISSSYSKAFSYYLSQAKQYWLEQNNEYLEGMIALALSRNNEQGAATDILKSLKEISQFSEELGRYWKNNSGGYYWMRASIETQALLIEAFHDITNDKQAVDEMQRWLIKNKQTNDWKTTKATAEACYALLLQGINMLAESSPADITLGKEKINPSSHPEIKAEAGTGYIKTSWSGTEIHKEMGDINITNKNKVPAYGALYWQYFEQLDKITMHETPLNIVKKLFVENNSPTGKVMTPVSDKQLIKVGDRLKVRIELRVDRDMEYVMMNDMRASGLEPENVISTYKWQDGLGYYESTHDASTDFFFDYLPKGTYVFEYPLRATQTGNFSNGITNIQSMYAPEFGAHSEGIRLNVGE